MIDENPTVEFNPEVTIVRIATTDDVVVLRELYERSKLEGELRINDTGADLDHLMDAYFECKDSGFWVAENESSIVGMVGVQRISDNSAEIRRLTGFSEETFFDMREAIQELKKRGQPNGLIIDLRYNPGGLLPTAKRIANLFINSGTIVSGETATGEELFKMRALPNRAHLADWDVVILINQSSASASEIVAGCVQAHDAGIIVGNRSWGKGSVQTVHQIARDASVKLTTQYYRLPSADGGETPGRLVHKMTGSTDWGVVPDVEVGITIAQDMESRTLRREADMIVKSSKDDRPDINRLITDGLDPQLETALLLLRANALSRVISEHRHARNTISEMISEQQRANQTN